MEDLFYLSKLSVSGSDVLEACKATGISRVTVFPDGVQAHYEEGQFWDWQFLSEERGDLEGFEPRQRQKLVELQIQTLIAVSYRHVSMGRLVPVLRLLMSKHGGWVATDDAAFETLYDVENVGHLVRA